MLGPISMKKLSILKALWNKKSHKAPSMMADTINKQLKMLLYFTASTYFGILILNLIFHRTPLMLAYYAVATVVFIVFGRFISEKNVLTIYWICFCTVFIQSSINYVLFGSTYLLELYFMALLPITSYSFALNYRSKVRRYMFIGIASVLCMLAFVYFQLLPHIFHIPLKVSTKAYMIFMIYTIFIIFGTSAMETAFFVKHMFKNISDIEEENTKLFVRANYDDLTGLYNRYKINLFLHERFSRYINYAIPLSVCMGDIDHFKQINDTYGHNAGDFILKGVADIMNNNIRKSTDHLGRWGGEEFLLIMPTPKDFCFERVEALRALIESHIFEFEGKSISITLTFGIAGASKDTATPDALVDLADKMLYEGKHSGRNRTVCAP